MHNLNAIFPHDLTGFCTYEIDTPREHLAGGNFDGEPAYNRNPLFQPNLETITLQQFAQILAAHCLTFGIQPSGITGHITTSNGICIDVSELLASYLDEREIAELFA